MPSVHCLFLGRFDTPIRKYDSFNTFDKISFSTIFDNFHYIYIYIWPFASFPTVIAGTTQQDVQTP